MKPVSSTPCRSANSLDVLIFLLRIRRAQRRRQLTSRWPVMVVMRPSTMGSELTESVAVLPTLAAGLAGRGEKVPWPH
jgi:hypothetical protein